MTVHEYKHPQTSAVKVFSQIEIGTLSNIKKIVEISNTYKKHIEKDLNMSFDAAFKQSIKDLTNPNEENKMFQEDTFNKIVNRGFKFMKRIYKLSFDNDCSFIKSFEAPADMTEQFIVYTRARKQVEDFEIGYKSMLMRSIHLTQLPLLIQELEMMKVTATGEDLLDIERTIKYNTDSYENWIQFTKVEISNHFDVINIPGDTFFEKIANFEIALVTRDDSFRRENIEKIYNINRNAVKKLQHHNI